VAPDGLARACAAFGVSDPVPVATTPTSHVYKVRRADERAGALKLLTEAGREEITGARFMDWRGGQGTARILGLSGDAILIEWLDGPSLGAMMRAGDVALGAEVIAGLIPRLRAGVEAPRPALPTLEERFSALLQIDLTDLAPAIRAPVTRAAGIARHCLAQAGPPVPLHGDLHHDNILQRADGTWSAIDAKGVIGCRGYEVANSFGNPLGLPHITRDPAHHAALATRFARVLDLPERRILEWAAAHMGLALCWAAGDDDGGVSEWAETLPVLLSALDA
jgi:streptomycin 6-kinase